MSSFTSLIPRPSKPAIDIGSGELTLTRMRPQSPTEPMGMLFVKCYRLSEPGIAEYALHHREYVDDNLDKRRRICFCYDVRGLEIPADLGMFRNLVSVHQSCRSAYEEVLVCTAIITNNSLMTAFINGMFTTLYRPMRPVRLFYNPTTIDDFISECSAPALCGSVQLFSSRDASPSPDCT